MYQNTIGLLGGMGSFATLDFFGRLLEGFSAEKEWERPRIIVDNYCTMPSRVRAILYQENVDKLMSDLSASVEMLNKYPGKVYIILVCNTCHYYLPDLKKRFPEVSFVDIIDAMTKDLVDKGIRKVFLMASEGTIKSQIYDKYFQPFGINIEYPNDYKTIRYFIECVKQNKISETDVNLFGDYIDSILEDSVVLACTELPVLAKKIESRKLIFDPLESALQRLKIIME